MLKTMVKRVSVTFIVSLILFGLIFIFGGLFEKTLIRKATPELVGYFINEGASDETIDVFLDEMISTDSKVGKFVRNHISGEDINDIYHALTGRVRCEVIGVEILEHWHHYRIAVRLKNTDNIVVAKKAAELYWNRDESFLEKVGRIIGDIADTDKTKLIASLMSVAAGELESEDYPDLNFSRVFVVDAVFENLFSSDGSIEPRLENDTKSLLLCLAGIPANVRDPDGGQVIDNFESDFGNLVFWFFAINIVLGIKNFYSLSKSYRTERSSGGSQSTPVIKHETVGALTSPEVISNVKRGILHCLSPQHGGMLMAVYDTPVVIGRETGACSVVFREGAVGVSSKHCCVSYDSSRGVFILKDLGSTYGTFLGDGYRLKPGEERFLRAGEVFYTGDRSNCFSVEER